MKNTNFPTEFQTALQQMFNLYSPQEIEDILFSVFSRANQHSDGDLEDTRTEREFVHTELRNLLRLISQNKESFNQIMHTWTKHNTTEIT